MHRKNLPWAPVFSPLLLHPLNSTVCSMTVFRDGSLLVDVELNVRQSGGYHIEANLFTSDNAPVAWGFARADLSQGLQKVTLTFFGRIIRQKEEDGPYVVKDLRGHRFSVNPLALAKADDPPGSTAQLDKILAQQETNAPDRRLIPYSNLQYGTAKYDNRSFSDKEYTSIKKEDTVERLREDQELEEQEE